MLKFTLYLNLYFGIIAAFTNLETIPNNYLETFKYQNNVYYNTKNLELSDFENSNINIIPVIFVYNLLKHPYLNETLYRIDIESTKRILLDNGYTNDQLYEIIIDERFPNEFLLGYTGCKDVMKINKLISILTNEFGYDSVNIVVDSLSGVLVDRAVSGEYLESFGESCYPGEPILKKINSIISFPLLNHGLFTCNIPPSFLFEIYNDKNDFFLKNECLKDNPLNGENTFCECMHLINQLISLHKCWNNSQDNNPEFYLKNKFFDVEYFVIAEHLAKPFEFKERINFYYS